jgi:hypothetical protein
MSLSTWPLRQGILVRIHKDVFPQSFMLAGPCSEWHNENYAPVGETNSAETFDVVSVRANLWSTGLNPHGILE